MGVTSKPVRLPVPATNHGPGEHRRPWFLSVRDRKAGLSASLGARDSIDDLVFDAPPRGMEPVVATPAPKNQYRRLTTVTWSTP